MGNLFNLKGIKGLSGKEAEKRLKVDGYNELPNTKGKNWWQIFFNILKEPMFLLLIACGLFYLFLSDIKEALILLSSLVLIIIINFYQEQKTEKALIALKDLSSPRALVLRDGKKIRISGKEVVRDDIVFVSEGDRVPADAIILELSSLSVDESILTGESVPVRKIIWDGKSELSRPGGEDIPLVFSGSMVVKGWAIARVINIGVNTEMGKIGKALETLKPEQTKLQKQTSSLVRGYAVFGIFLCFLVVVIYFFTRHDLVSGLLAGLSLAIAILPEEFPVVMTVFLALGAWRLSRENVLTRRIPAVETLGAVTSLCVDKTGTLTQNKMMVKSAWAVGNIFNLRNKDRKTPLEVHELLEYGLLATPFDPFDPME
ncbi:MAG: HAD-IC family P-type ATPase, partial [Candidatus Falkowbacteria bacterium]|nr:HAD-IC family P-type ATPase [Candidatus Falkowbacteria bacterium]